MASPARAHEMWFLPQKASALYRGGSVEGRESFSKPLNAPTGARREVSRIPVLYLTHRDRQLQFAG